MPSTVGTASSNTIRLETRSESCRLPDHIEAAIDDVIEVVNASTDTNVLPVGIEDRIVQLASAFRAFRKANGEQRHGVSYLRLVSDFQELAEQIKGQSLSSSVGWLEDENRSSDDTCTVSASWTTADKKAFFELRPLYVLHSAHDDEWEELGNLLFYDSSLRLSDGEESVHFNANFCSPNPSFESSPSYFPEIYSMTPIFPLRYKFIGIMTFPLETFSNTEPDIIVKYHLLYAQTPRNWVAVTVTVSNSSGIGDELLPLLEQRLESTNFCDTVTHVGFPHSCGDYPDAHSYAADATISEDISESKAYIHSNHVMKVDDICCPQYLDSDVITLGEHPNGEHQWSLSQSFSLIHRVLVEGNHCVAKRIPFSPGMEAFWYELYGMHSLRGSQNVVGFHGVVLEDNRQKIKAYLLELDIHGTLESFLKNTKIGLPLAVIEAWAYQIIQGVGEVHARSLVVGRLAVSTIGLFDNWQPKLCTLSRQPIPNEKGRLAPELRSKTTRKYPMLDPENMTPQGDIYQLGLLLWTLVEQIPGQHSILVKELCKRAKCPSLWPSTIRAQCRAQHCNPLDLPPVSRQLPLYLQDIIRECREPDPLRRPSARELLEHFPPHIASQNVSGILSTLTSASSKLQVTRPVSYVRCDNCNAGPVTNHYHCSTCDQGDYDICEDCVKKDVRCRDEKHWLFRRRLEDGKIYWELGGNIPPR